MIMKQSNVASVHGKHTAIMSFDRGINFVQASVRVAMDQATAATKIIEMKGDEFTARDRQMKRKLLRCGN